MMSLIKQHLESVQQEHSLERKRLSASCAGEQVRLRICVGAGQRLADPPSLSTLICACSKQIQYRCEEMLVALDSGMHVTKDGDGVLQTPCGEFDSHRLQYFSRALMFTLVLIVTHTQSQSQSQSRKQTQAHTLIHTLPSCLNWNRENLVSSYLSVRL